MIHYIYRAHVLV